MSKVVVVDWPDMTYEKLAFWAQQTGQTVNDFIREALMAKLDEREAGEESEEDEGTP